MVLPGPHLATGVHINPTLLLGDRVELHPDVTLNVAADGAAAVHHGVRRPVRPGALDDHHVAHDLHGGAVGGHDERTTDYLGLHSYLPVREREREDVQFKLSK